MIDFWVDKVARECIERADREGKKEIVVKGAASPSGGKHIGNLNDVIRAHFVYRSLRDAGRKSRFVHCSDDRDPFRKVPDRVPNLDGEWKTLAKDESESLKKYMGFPYVNVPDPFGCCKSWAHHFNKVWMDGAKMLGIEPEDYSDDELYRKGKFDATIRLALEKLELSRKVIARFQQNIGNNWFPMSLICENCGRINGRVTAIDLHGWKGEYVCESRVLGTKGEAEGCGHKGITSLRNGKLSWRFEWPAQWLIFDVLHEPFGKDHAEGSWPSGQVISREIYGREPPVPHVYEFFLVNGEKMSASSGNVYITQDMLKFLEPEVFLYFYTKKPAKQRDLDIKNIFRLVNEFDEIEEIYFGLRKADEREGLNARRGYELANQSVPKTKPSRIPYVHASLISQTSPEDLEFALKKALEFMKLGKDDGHVKKRLKLAYHWARNFAPEDVVVSLKPDAHIVSTLSNGQRLAMKKLKEELSMRWTTGKDWSFDDLQNRIFDLAKESGIQPQELFIAIYQVLLGRNQGPKAGYFIGAIGTDRVAKILDKLGL